MLFNSEANKKQVIKSTMCGKKSHANCFKFSCLCECQLLILIYLYISIIQGRTGISKWQVCHSKHIYQCILYYSIFPSCQQCIPANVKF